MAEEYYVKREMPHKSEADPIDLKIIEEIKPLGKCIDCMICLDRCPAHQRRNFYGPMFMVQLLKLLKHPYDTADRIEKAYKLGVWNCIQCQQCKETCPQDIDPAKAIRELRMAGLQEFIGIKKSEKSTA
jgi:succinate dehydrogenase/fumarate reductase-like Fe-S protein